MALPKLQVDLATFPRAMTITFALDSTVGDDDETVTVAVQIFQPQFASCSNRRKVNDAECG